MKRQSSQILRTLDKRVHLQTQKFHYEVRAIRRDISVINEIKSLKKEIRVMQFILVLGVIAGLVLSFQQLMFKKVPDQIIIQQPAAKVSTPVKPILKKKKGIK